MPAEVSEKNSSQAVFICVWVWLKGNSSACVIKELSQSMLEEHSEQTPNSLCQRNSIVARPEWIVFQAPQSRCWKYSPSPEFSTRLSPLGAPGKLWCWSAVRSRILESDWQEKQRTSEARQERACAKAKSRLSPADEIWRSNRAQGSDLQGKWMIFHHISILNDTKKLYF